jgi:hypothetical protein
MFEMQVTDGSGESFNARPLNPQRREIVHGGGDDNDDGDVDHVVAVEALKAVGSISLSPSRMGRAQKPRNTSTA